MTGSGDQHGHDLQIQKVGKGPVTRENVVIEAAARIVAALDELPDAEAQIKALALAFGWIERCSTAPFRTGKTPRPCDRGHIGEVHGVSGCLRCACVAFPV